MKVKWDAVFELINLIVSSVYLVIAFGFLFSNIAFGLGIRFGYFQVVMFFLMICLFEVSLDSLIERFENAKEK